jgi:hypothetical protein
LSIVCDLAAAAREGCRAKKGLKTLVKLRTRAHEALTNAQSGNSGNSGNSGGSSGNSGNSSHSNPLPSGTSGANDYAGNGVDAKPNTEPTKVSSINHLIDPVEVPLMLPNLANHNYPHSQHQHQHQHHHQHQSQMLAQNQSHGSSHHAVGNANANSIPNGNANGSGKGNGGEMEEPYHTGFSDPMTFTPLPDFHLSPEDPLASPIDILGFNIDDFLTEMRDDNLLFLS